MTIIAQSKGSAEPADSILERLKGVDGANSGLDADQLDGYEAEAFALATHNHDTDYAPLAQGVTNGDSHDHLDGDGAQIAHSSLGGIGPDDHHTRYTNEEARDAVAAALVAGGDVTITVDDAMDLITIACSDTWRPVDDTPVNGVTDESISSNWAYDHANNASAHHSRYTDAEAQTAINNDADHGSTASHDYYTDADAQAAINADADHGSTAPHDYYTDTEALTAAEAGATDTATASKLMKRSSAGDVWCRLFRSSYSSTNANIAGIYTTQTIGGDYMRPSTPAQVVSAMGLSTNSAVQFASLVLSGHIKIDTQAYFNAMVDNGNSGTSQEVNWTNGNKQKVLMTGNCTFSFTAPSGPTNLLIIIQQDATGGRTATWPTSVVWPNGVVPSLSAGANAIDVMSFLYDGTTFYGTLSPNFG